jgi:predicted transcriptional regulator
MSRSEQHQHRERLSARVDPAVAEMVEQVAQAERRPISAVVRNVLEDWAKTQTGQVAA